MGETPPVRLILASGSPARRELLTRAGLAFTVRPANIDEPDDQNFPDPRTMVQQIAWLKAAAVAPRVAEGLVLAADTIGWLNGRAIGKPADETDARRIIGTLAGTRHELWTGVILWRRPDDLQVAWQERSLVEIAPLTAAEITRYLATRTWQGCSGAYAIQEGNDPHVRVVRGSVSNVIGLPLETTLQVLGWLAAAPLLAATVPMDAK